jgi:glutamyl-tRNA synthetase
VHSLRSTLDQAATDLGIGVGKILPAMRLAITGIGGGPDLMMIMEIIGRDEVVSRVQTALQTLEVKIS